MTLKEELQSGYKESKKGKKEEDEKTLTGDLKLKWIQNKSIDKKNKMGKKEEIEKSDKTMTR